MQKRVLVATTGKRSELVTSLPITAAARKSPRVAMSLGPHGANQSARLPDLRPGDKLLVTAEAQVTTDTAAQGVTNVGRPYSYNPIVSASVLLAASPKETTPKKGRSISLAVLKPVTLTQIRHHHVVVSGEVAYTIPPGGLPWPAEQTCVNLVLAASHPKAKAGNVLIVGENEPDGSVKGDKGRVNAIRLRPGNQPMRKATPSRTPLATTIPVDKDARTVVFSQRLGSLKKGEQLAVRCKLVTSADHLTYPARISTRIFLADRRAQSDTGGNAQKLASAGGELCENSGFNCSKKEGPCITRRAGVLRIEADASGDQYLNVVAVSGDPKRKAKAGDSLRVVSGFLERVRYPPEMRG